MGKKKLETRMRKPAIAIGISALAVAAASIGFGMFSTSTATIGGEHAHYADEAGIEHVVLAQPISGGITWNDDSNADQIRPSEVTVKLMDVKGNEIARQNVSEAINWNYSFTEVPKELENKGCDYYTLEVEGADDYATEVDGSDITETYKGGYTSVAINGVWDDDGDRDGLRPTKMKVTIYRASDNIERSMEITGEDLETEVEVPDGENGETIIKSPGWSCTFTDIPCRADGTASPWIITQEVDDLIVKEYSFDPVPVNVASDSAQTYRIVNAHEIYHTTVEIENIWEDANGEDGMRPEFVEVDIKDSNGIIVDTVKMWSYDTYKNTFPRFANHGMEVTYSVGNIRAEGYKSDLEDNSDYGQNYDKDVDVDSTIIPRYGEEIPDEHKEYLAEPTEEGEDLVDPALKKQYAVLAQPDGYPDGQYELRFYNRPLYTAGDIMEEHDEGVEPFYGTAVEVFTFTVAGDGASDDESSVENNEQVDENLMSVQDNANTVLDDVASITKTMPWRGQEGKIKSVVFVDEITPVSCENWFLDFANVSEFKNIDTNLNMSNVASTESMFAGSGIHSAPEFLNGGTKNVTNMREMFRGCASLVSTDNIQRYWDTSSVVNMSGMFAQCNGLVEANVDGIDCSSVTDMSEMFTNCSELTKVALSQWDCSKVTTFKNMFNNCAKLSDINVSSWKCGKASDFEAMFCGCSALDNDDLNISDWDADKAQNLTRMLSGTGIASVPSMSSWSFDEVDNVSNMFSDCDNIVRFTFVNNMPKPVDMTGMVNGCDSLQTVRFTGNINPTSIDSLFGWDNELTTVEITGGSASNLTNVNNVFTNCGKLSTISIPTWTSSIDNLKTILASANKNTIAHLDLANWNNTNTPSTNCASLFANFANLETIDLSHWKTNASVDMTNMFANDTKLTTVVHLFGQSGSAASMFNNCTNLKNFAFEQFNPKTAENMFYHSGITSVTAGNFTGSKDCSLEGMFDNCTSLTSVKLNALTQAENMNNMLFNCTKLDTVEMNAIANVPGGVESMFAGCKQLQNVSMSALTINNGASTENMFKNCIALTSVNLPNITQVGSADNMFAGCASLNTNPLPKLETADSMKNMFSGCKALTSIAFNGAGGTTTSMSGMFADCVQLGSVDMSSWGCMSLQDISNMFRGCTSLITVKISPSSNYRKIQNSNPAFVNNVDDAFAGCNALNTLIAPSWMSKTKSPEDLIPSDVRGKITTLNLQSWGAKKTNNDFSSNAFKDFTGLNELYIGYWNTNGLYTAGKTAFVGIPGIIKNIKSHVEYLDISHWNFNGSTHLNYLFARSTLIEIDMSNCQANSAFSAEGMFQYSANLKNVLLSSDVTSKIHNFGSMFAGCSGMDNLEFVKNWDMSNAECLHYMFGAVGSNSATSISNLNFSWNFGNYVPKSLDLTATFYLANITGIKNISSNGWDDFNGRIGRWNGSTFQYKGVGVPVPSPSRWNPAVAKAPLQLADGTYEDDEDCRCPNRYNGKWSPSDKEVAIVPSSLPIVYSSYGTISNIQNADIMQSVKSEEQLINVISQEENHIALPEYLVRYKTSGFVVTNQSGWTSDQNASRQLGDKVLRFKITHKLATQEATGPGHSVTMSDPMIMQRVGQIAGTGDGAYVLAAAGIIAIAIGAVSAGITIRRKKK